MTSSKKALILFILAFSICGLLLILAHPINKYSKWGKLSTFFKTTKPNKSSYNVEAAGWNIMVVEWIPADNSNYKCMFVSGTEKAGVGCYKVEYTNKQNKLKLDVLF